MFDLKDSVYSYTQTIMTEIVSKQEKATIKAIQEYCEKHGYIPNIIEKEKLELILKLGIAEYERRKIEK